MMSKAQHAQRLLLAVQGAARFTDAEMGQALGVCAKTLQAYKTASTDKMQLGTWWKLLSMAEKLGIRVE